MRTTNNLLFHTFIDLNVEVIRCSDYSNQGLKGRIVDETKNMIIIERANGKEKKLPKTACVFRFFLEDGKTMDVDGSAIAFRPVERPKKINLSKV